MAETVFDALWEALDDIADAYTATRTGLLANQAQMILQGVSVWLGREMACGVLCALMTREEHAALVAQLALTVQRGVQQGTREVQRDMALYSSDDVTDASQAAVKGL